MPRSWPGAPRAGRRPPRSGARLALGELLADAQDRPQAGVHRPAELASDQRVGLAGVAAPLRVADDHPVGQADQHRRADLAGVGALQLVMDVLGADAHVRHRRPWPSASRTAARRTNGGQMTRVHAGHVASGPRSSRASSPASAGVVCIFQLAAMMTGRIARIMPEPPAPRSAARCSIRSSARWTDERWSRETFGQLGQGRLGCRPSGVCDEAHDRWLLGEPSVRLELVDRRRAGGRRR